MERVGGGTSVTAGVKLTESGKMHVDKLSPTASGPHVQEHDRDLDDPRRERLVGPTGAESTVTALPYNSVKKTRSRRALSSLRKSLAWDKAFSTDEGVLDVDELPLVARTPRKLAELHPLDIPEILAKASPSTFFPCRNSTSNGERVVDPERMKSSPILGSIHSECVPSAEAMIAVGPAMLEWCFDAVKTQACETFSKIASPAITDSLETKICKSVTSRPVLVNRLIKAAVQKVSGSPRPAPVNQITKADMQKGTKLRLPTTFTRKIEKSEESPRLVNCPQNTMLLRCKSASSLLSPSSASSSISKKVSSVSKKVKDTLGKVLPGGFGGSATNRKSSVEGPSGDHQGSGLKTFPTPLISLGHTLYDIEEVPNSQLATSITRSKSARSCLSVNSMEVNTNIGSEDMRAEMSNQKATTSEFSGNVPNSKVSLRLGDERPWGSSCRKVGPVPRKGTGKPPLSSRKVGEMFSKKRPVAEPECAASGISAVEKVNSTNSSPSATVVYSSSLRMPSPKMGFFETVRPSTAHRPSNLRERELGTASEAPTWQKKRNSLPPRPQQNLLHGLARQSGNDNDLAVVGSRPLRSGIPSAPHLRSSGKHENRLEPSASAPTSPHKNGSELLSPAARAAVTGRYRSYKSTADRIHSGIQDPGSHTLRRGTSGTFRELKLGSSDGYSDHPLNLVERDSDTQSETIEVLSDWISSGDQHSIKLVDSSALSNTKSPVQPPSSSIQLPGCKERGRCYGQPSILQDPSHLLTAERQEPHGSELFHSFLSRDEVGGSNNIRACTISFSRELELENICDKLPINKFDSSGSLDVATIIDVDSGNATVYRLTPSLEFAVEENAHGLSEYLSKQVSLEDASRCLQDASRFAGKDLEKENLSKYVCGWQEMHSSLASSDSGVTHTINQASKSFPSRSNIDSSVERTLRDDSWSSENGKLDIEDSSKVMAFGMQELCIGNSCQNPCARVEKSISAAFCSQDEVQKSVNLKPQDQDTRCEIEHIVDMASYWLDEPLGGASSHEMSVVKDCSSPIVPPFPDRLSSPETVTVESASLVADFDFPSGKCPLAVNLGLLNGIDCHTPATPPSSRKERGLCVVFVQSPSEEKPGQENSMVSGTQGGTAYLHKPKQRKSLSSHKADHSRTRGTLELSFPFSEERLRALEAAGQETLQKKSGAVQHSPPNKISPNQNPWSPVKRIGQQLGPFDCTKKYTNGGVKH